MEIVTTTLNAISSIILLYVLAFNMGRGVINSTAMTIEEHLRNKVCLVGMAQILFSFVLAMPPILLAKYNIPFLTLLYSFLCLFLSVVSLDYQQKEKKSFLTGWRNTKYSVWAWIKGMKIKQKFILGLYLFPPIPLGIAFSIAKLTSAWLLGLISIGFFAFMPPIVLFLMQYLDEIYTRNKEINFFEQNAPDMLEKMSVVNNATKKEKELNA